MIPRWKATVSYRHNSGVVPVEYDIEELADLQVLVERGPDWRTITSIAISLERNRSPNLTVEQSEEV